MLENGVEFESVDRFCYLGDMISAGGGADFVSRTRVRCAWSKFRELEPILTAREASLKLKGKIDTMCVQSVMKYGRIMASEGGGYTASAESGKNDGQVDGWCYDEE